MSAPLSSRNWLGKVSAGVLAGFALSLCLCGLFYRLVPGGGDAKVQMTMWLMAPLWAGILSFCFLFRDGWRAWGWLGGAALVAYCLFLVA